MTYLLLMLALPFVLTVGLMPFYIHWMRARAMGQSIRAEGLETHQHKSGTPTAGGIVFLVAIGLSAVVLQWLGPHSFSMNVWAVLGVTGALALVGYADDALKMVQKKNDGLSGYIKLMAQVGLGLALGVYLMQSHGGVMHFFGGYLIPLGWLYPVFCALVMVATSNAVNLTDGVDGLAASSLMVTLLAFFVVFTGGGILHSLSLLPTLSPDLAPVCVMVIGGLLGFWMFNRYPAQVFMGDTGSLALGGTLASLALVSGLEWYIVCFGVLYVIEAFSVCAQVASFKLTGKRLLKMSPIHHHFELVGWNEPKIVSRFLLVQLMGCVAGFFLYLYSAPMLHNVSKLAIF